MKMFMILAALGVACFLVIACSDKPPSTIGEAGKTDSEIKPAPVAQVEQSEAQALAQEATSAPSEVTEIDGRLIQTEKGLAIATGTDAYVVAGRDLSDMLGKMVKVTGAIAEVDGGQVIEVMTVTPME